jgi:VWFA-related protein
MTRLRDPRLALAAVGVAIVSVPALHGGRVDQPRPQVPLQTPTFRSGVDVVRLDVSVFDRERRPIRGLRAADFTVFENGVRQDVVVFEPVEVPDAVQVETPWIHDAVPDITTNEPAEGRLWVLMLDDATAHPEMWAFDAVKRIGRSIVEKRDPADRMAVVFTLQEINARDFTNVRARLLAAIDDYDIGFFKMGQFKDPRFAQASAANRISDVYFQGSGARTLWSTVNSRRHDHHARRGVSGGVRHSRRHGQGPPQDEHLS